MIVTMSAPSKTFLSGEYAALLGAPAVVLNTEPRFELCATRGASGVSGIPTLSPAYRWLEQRAPLWRDWKLEFRDPHNGLGGFGASSAQFLLLHTFTTFLQVSVSRALEGVDLKALLNDFQVLSQGQASGADLLAQVCGQVAVVDPSSGTVVGQPWPYPDLDFAILRTQQKVNTHQHLQDLEREQLVALVQPAKELASGFGRDSSEQFVAKFKSWGGALKELNLQSARALELMAEITAQPWALGCKGCGALGADTVMILFAAQDRSLVEAFINRQLRTTRDLSSGLAVHWSWQ